MPNPSATQARRPRAPASLYHEAVAHGRRGFGTTYDAEYQVSSEVQAFTVSERRPETR